jgi:hypothetical protein
MKDITLFGMNPQRLAFGKLNNKLKNTMRS